MNYYQARQMVESGLWHYTCMNDGSVWPVGYCAPDEACPSCQGYSKFRKTESVCETCANQGFLPRATPCPGHATKEEAQDHYKQYLLDSMTFVSKQGEWPKNKCEAKDCNQEGTHVCLIPCGYGSYFQVCKEHADRESISSLVHVGSCACS